jgi:hypothetical protein
MQGAFLFEMLAPLFIYTSTHLAGFHDGGKTRQWGTFPKYGAELHYNGGYKISNGSLL